MKKFATDIYSESQVKSSKAATLRLRSHVHLCGFLLSVFENRRIIQGDAEPQITLADYVFKMKYAIGNYPCWPTQNDRNQILDF